MAKTKKYALKEEHKLRKTLKRMRKVFGCTKDV
jgi:hypothetical protein